MKNKLLYVFTFLLINFSCSQQNNKQQTSTMNEITSANFVEKVSEQIKHYDYEPLYFLRVQHYGHYELLVNDVPVFKYYRDASYGSPIEINNAILKTGKQKVTFRLFSEKGFDETDDFNIKVGVLDNKGRKHIEDERLVATYITKSGELPVGQNYYEGNFMFDATVPYDNKGWSEGQDLTKFDKKELESAVVTFYKKMWNIYNDKNRKEAQFPLIVEREREIGKSKYYEKKDIEDIIQEFLLPYTNETYVMQPIENYKMVFYGDGKLTGLEQTTSDIRLRGQSAFWAKYKTAKGSNMAYATRILLYLPLGKRLEDGLQIIR